MTEIDHVAIAVYDLEVAIEWYDRVLGVRLVHREHIESEGVEEALLEVAESYIQLLSPTREDSTVARFLRRRGEGIHHIGYRVADCEAALTQAEKEGAQAITPLPLAGSRGTTVAFLRPSSAFGTLIELVQE